MSIWKKREKTGLENARDEALLELASFEAHDENYKEVMVHVDTLSKLIDLEKSEKLSPNTLAVILGNAVIALFVVGYESKNVVRTTVQSFMTKITR